jgi:uncharacterized protein with NRDE domain
MCLILFAWQAHPRYPLIAAANRDEFHERPTAAAEFWGEAPQLLAGRDLQAGGTWLGVTRSGRFAAITNYREPRPSDIPFSRSRGALVRDFLIGTDSPTEYAGKLSPTAGEYAGFSLLLGDTGSLVCVSNRDGPPALVPPGVHGLSNHLLNTPWPKVRAGRERLSALMASDRMGPEDLLRLLKDRAMTPGDFPDNLDGELVSEQLANHYFIVSPSYGTRSSTVVLVSHEAKVSFTEREYGPNGRRIDTRRYDFEQEG